MGKSDKKLILIIGLISFCVVAIAGTFFGLRIYNTFKLEKTAEKYVELKDYDGAISAYNKLIIKSDKEKYRKRLDVIKKLDESNKNFIDGEKSFKKEKYSEAFKYLVEVIKDDKDNYKSAKEMIEEIEKIHIAAIEASIEDMNFEDAENKVEEYKEVFGESELVSGLTIKIDAGKEKKEIEEKEKEELALAKEELDKLKRDAESIKKKNTSRSTAGYGTYYVTSSRANVRSGPSTGSSVITYVSQGSSVYIYETVEDIGRTWCHAIITSSVTGNSYDGWISSRNLDYSL